MQQGATNTSKQGLSRDFWIFWTGQTISNLGSSFTRFALPLLIFRITDSALNLGLATAVTYLPYLLFGLILGAWADRVNRKQLMIGSDLARTLLIISITLTTALNISPVWWIYAVMFMTSTVGICFNAAQTAALPSLVPRQMLLTANGRIQASYSATTIIGPVLAGLLVLTLPMHVLLLCDAITFLVSALSISLIRVGFNTNTVDTTTTLRANIAGGIEYVFRHPVLRTIALLTGILSFTGSTVDAQVVLFAKDQFQASDYHVGLFHSAGGVGIVLLSLSAGSFRKYWTFSQVALGTAILKGLMIIGIGLTPWYWFALLLWALSQGLSTLFAINTLSLRQTIVPEHLLGRVQTIGQVISWSAIPLGTFLGGLVIEQTQDIRLVYTMIGIFNFLIAVSFILSPLGKAERYLQGIEPNTMEVLS